MIAKIQDVSKEIAELKKINSEIDKLWKKQEALNIHNYLNDKKQFKAVFAKYTAISEQMGVKMEAQKSLLHIIRREIWIGAEYKIYSPNQPFYIGEFKIEIKPDASGFPHYFIIDNDNRDSHQYLFFEDYCID